MTPELLLIGVGAGDPDWVTLEAVRAIESLDVLFVVVKEGHVDELVQARRVILQRHRSAPLRTVELQDPPRPWRTAPDYGAAVRLWRAQRRDQWAAAVAAELGDGQTGGFLVWGDPSVYSTFSYLAAEVRASVPGLVVELVPGITAMQALAAAAKVPLVEGQEALTLVPVTAGLDAVATALDSSDTVVAYKGGRRLAALLALIRERRPDAVGVMGTDVGLPGQRLQRLSEIDAEAAPYFSTILVAPARPLTGGRL